MNTEHLLHLLSARAAALRAGDTTAAAERICDLGDMAISGASQPVRDRAATEYARSCGCEIELLCSFSDLLSAAIGLMAALASGDKTAEDEHREKLQLFLQVDDLIESGGPDPLRAARAQIAQQILTQLAAKRVSRRAASYPIARNSIY